MTKKKSSQRFAKFLNRKKVIAILQNKLFSNRREGELLPFIRNDNRFLRSFLVISSFSFFFILFSSCTKEHENQPLETTEQIQLPSSGIEISGAWARPGREGGTSAIYMDILNGSSQTDTLISISSAVAGMTEVHESYEKEEGMMGMRSVETVIAPGQDILSLQPGGLHVMLMKLNRPLAEGDSVEFRVEFANAGKKNLTVPVQLLNR